MALGAVFSSSLVLSGEEVVPASLVGASDVELMVSVGGGVFAVESVFFPARVVTLSSTLGLCCALLAGCVGGTT